MKNFKIITKTNKHHISHVNDDIKNGKHVFLFVFMDGCGPCNATIPQWDALKPHSNKFDNISISRVNNSLFDQLQNAGDEPPGYPSLRHINNGVVEEFENSGLSNPSRNTGSFLEWIKSKIPSTTSSKSKSKSRSKSKSKSSKSKSKSRSRSKSKSRSRSK